MKNVFVLVFVIVVEIKLKLETSGIPVHSNYDDAFNYHDKVFCIKMQPSLNPSIIYIL